jgi:hypothetical protein
VGQDWLKVNQLAFSPSGYLLDTFRRRRRSSSVSLNLFLILVALLGLVAALWVQVRAMGADPAAFARSRRRAGMGLAALLLLIALVHFVNSGIPARWLSATQVDGSWGAVAIDGRRVRPEAYSISIASGAVSGGHDDCNSWSFSDEPPRADGERMIFTTLVACPEDDPIRRAYWALATAPGVTPELRPDGKLRIAARGHEGIFRRCRWERRREPGGASGSGSRFCVME